MLIPYLTFDSLSLNTKKIDVIRHIPIIIVDIFGSKKLLEIFKKFSDIVPTVFPWLITNKTPLNNIIPPKVSINDGIPILVIKKPFQMPINVPIKRTAIIVGIIGQCI